MTKLSRRSMIKTMGITTAAIAGLKTFSATVAEAATKWWKPTPQMDAMTAIHTRRSVRKFTAEDVTDEQVRTLLAAAMAAPSAGNEQPWEFVVVRDRETLGQVKKISKYAGYAAKSPVSILVCANLDYDKYDGYWIEDVSAATQNILLAAHANGLGAVWTGCYPDKERIKGFRKLFKLPSKVVPVALVVLGHPAKTPAPKNRFKEDRIHQNEWNK